MMTRSLIEAQLLQLFDEALEPPLVVAIDVAELGEPSLAPLISEEGRAQHQPTGGRGMMNKGGRFERWGEV